MRQVLLHLLLWVCTAAQAQSPWQTLHLHFEAVLKAPEAVRHIKATQFYDSLLRVNQIPFVLNDSVMFLYLGDAGRVAWYGDFNQWGQKDAPSYEGKRITGTPLWYLKARFVDDARLDYKIILNSNTWILDPANPQVQWSGVGGGSPNSELRMPGWQPDSLTRTPITTQRGKITEEQLFFSNQLGYQTSYTVYLPHNYHKGQRYPVLYVTDGYEYAHPRLGDIQTVLDNLIGLGKIREIIVVLIDHREPANRSNNRRMQELAMNSKYLAFLTDELIPHVEAGLPVSGKREERGILGTSMGGLAALYFAYARPDVFGMTAVQSPAFWVKPEIFAFCEQAKNLPVKLYLSCGTYYDGTNLTRKMKAQLQQQGCPFTYIETHQGHSWGNWRDQLDDILVYFFKP
jgi:enterochelin esterase family protein